MFSASATLIDTANEENTLFIDQVTVKEAINQGVVITAIYTIDSTAASIGFHEVGQPIDVRIHAQEITGAGASASLSATNERRFRGVITQATFFREEGGANVVEVFSKVKLVIESRIRLLSRFKIYRTYTDLRPGQFIADMLAPTIGLSGFAFYDQTQFATTDSDTRSDYYIQAGDDCWSFLQYYLADNGIRMVVFPGDVGTEVIHLEDSLSTGEARILTLATYSSTTELNSVAIDNVNVKSFDHFPQEGASGKTIFYNYELGTIQKYAKQPESTTEQSELDITLKRPIEIPFKVLRQNGNKKFANRVLSIAGISTDEVERRSKFLYESQTINRWKVTLATRTPGLTAGMRIIVTSMIADDPNLFIESGLQVLKDGDYINEIVVCDGSEPWRAPPLIVPNMHADSTFIGRVDGSGTDADIERGKRVPLDHYGRAPVRLLWDTIADAGRPSSILCLRYLQKMSGGSYGIKYDPRHGDEVLIRLIHGRPDAAVIVGSLYNRTNVLPSILRKADGGIVYNVDSTNEDVFTGILFREREDPSTTTTTAETTPPEEEEEASDVAGSYVFKTVVFLPEWTSTPAETTTTPEVEPGDDEPTKVTVEVTIPTWVQGNPSGDETGQDNTDETEDDPTLVQFYLRTSQGETLFEDPAPEPEPEPEPAPEPEPEPATEPAPEPATEPATEPAPEPATEPATEPAPEPQGN